MVELLKSNEVGSWRQLELDKPRLLSDFRQSEPRAILR